MSKHKKHSPICKIPPPFFFDGTWTGDSYCIFDVNKVMRYVSMGTKYIGAIQSGRPFVVQNHGTKTEQFDFGAEDRKPNCPRVQEIVAEYTSPVSLTITGVLVNNPNLEDDYFRMFKIEHQLNSYRNQWTVDVMFLNDRYTPLFYLFDARVKDLSSPVQLYRNRTDSETVAVIMPLSTPFEGAAFEAIKTMQGVIYEKAASAASA